MDILKLLKDVEVSSINGCVDILIEDIFNDSREVKKNSMFICIIGNNVDGHDYIDEAISNGAICVVLQKKVQYRPGVTYVVVDNTSRAMSLIARNFFENPCDKINLIGVTGTNGKSSTISFIRQILEFDFKVGMLGTIEVYDGENSYRSVNTTPDSLSINKYLNKMVENGCKYCVMEVSSHALVLDRVKDVDYDIGVFTNLTQDHLDFHKNIDSYKKAKEKLFYKTKNINLFNIDDEVGEGFFKENKNKNTKNYTYAIEKNADFKVKNIRLYSHKIGYDLIVGNYIYEVEIPVVGYFNVYNTLAAISVCVLLGVDITKILERVSFLKNVSGRFEYVENDLDINIVVDYAHTPDALENLLKSARLLTKNRIILVFGCGGNRDRDKRNVMGKIAKKYSDIAIVTSDNPRYENQEDITNDILSEIHNRENIYVINDRKKAIKKSIEMYKRGDLIIIAGKGHEDYQVIDGKKYYFDDKKITKEIIFKHKKQGIIDI